MSKSRTAGSLERRLSIGAACLAASCCVASAVAQRRVLTVGPGRAFPDPASALAVARDGDFVSVDPGSYPAFAIQGVAVTVAPSGPGSIRVAATGGPGLTVSGVGAGRQVVVVGLDVTWTNGPGPAVAVLGNPGAVVLREVRVRAGFDPRAVAAPGMVSIEANGFVLVRDARFDPAGRVGSTQRAYPSIAGDDGLPAVTVAATSVVFDGVPMRGFDRGDGVPLRAGPALRVLDDSRVRFAYSGLGEVVVRGGDGARYGGDAVQIVAAPPLRVQSCGRHLFAPGRGGAGTSGEYAMDDDRGRIQAGGNTIDRAVPACRVDESGFVRIVSGVPRAGAFVDVEIDALLGPRSYVLLAAVRVVETPLALSPFQNLLLGFPGLAVVDVGTLPGPTYTARWSLRLPATPGLSGIPLAFQAVLGPYGTSDPGALTFADVDVIR